jgi:predicted RNA binding protein YcfA (HicA-like mRNA interferase family)
MTGKEVIRLLEKQGFTRARQSGSHVILQHFDGRRVTVPVHRGRDLGRGLLRQIFRDAGIDWTR